MWHGEERSAYSVLVRRLEGNRPLRGQGIGIQGKIILK